MSTPSSSPVPVPSSKPGESASKTVQVLSPQYVLYTDAELEQSRTTFYEKQRAGREGNFTFSKQLRCRLIRNTVTSMIAIKGAAGDDFQYPCSRELTLMAKRLTEYYPMLRDTSVASGAEWVRGYALFRIVLFTILQFHLRIYGLISFQESVKKQLLKRVQNVTTPKKKQGATPSRKRRRPISLESSSQESSTDDSGSFASTLILERSPPSRSSSPEA